MRRLLKWGQWVLRGLIAAIFSPFWLPVLIIFGAFWVLAQIVNGLCSFVIRGKWEWLND